MGAGKEQLIPFPIPGLFCGNMKHVTWENLPEEERAKLWTAFHRILEWFGLDGTLKYHLVQPPTMSRSIPHYIRLLRAPANLALLGDLQLSGPASDLGP